MARVVTDEQTLGTKRDSLRRENRFLYWFARIETAVGVLTVGWGVYRYLEDGSYAWLVIGGVVLGLGLSHLLKQRENRSDIAKVDSGQSGEQFVTRLLREELPDSCFLLNDLDVHDGLNSAQNDHVILSPSGIFVVETKAYGGTLRGSADDETWTQRKETDGRESTNQLTNPIRQNRYHVEVLEQFIENHRLPFQPEHIHSFVAMVNKSCEWTIEGDDSMVDYAWRIPDRIRSHLGTSRYSGDQLRELMEALSVEPPEELMDNPT